MAKEEDIELIRLGTDAVNAAAEGGHGPLDLRGANLSGLNLRGAMLAGADLRQTQLDGADLSFAHLTDAHLDGANLNNASLRGAYLASSSLGGIQASGTDFSGSTMGGTIVSSVDFSGARGLETVVHLSPSTVDPSTLLRTVRGYGDRLPGEVRSFFADAGIPVQFLDVLPAVTSKVVYYRCFIAHGDPDAAFAEKLYRTLKEMGVTCWFHRLDATPGERTWKEIAEQLRDAEKVIVICSGDSLVRDGLRKELERLIDEYPEKIVPVSLDDLWKHPGFRVIRGVKDLKPFLLEKNHADFQKHDYERALKDLLRGITARPVAEG